MNNDTASTAGPSEFFLPELPRLLAYAYHPQAAQIEFASNGWVRRFLANTFAGEAQLLHFLRQRNGIYGPLTVPEADYQRALDIADWYQFVTVIDSFVSDRSALGASVAGAREVFARIMGDFDAEISDDDGAAFPYGRAAQDLWRRISPGFSGAQRRRFAASLEAFLRGCTTEITAKLDGKTPDFETCLEVRLDSFGCQFIELMTEYGAGVDMSEHLGDLAEVHRHGRRQMIIVNDLLSWRKEHAQDDKMTAVRVLIEHDGLGLQEAVDRLCQLVQSHEKAYIAARDRVLDSLGSEGADLPTYLRSLDHVIGGSQEFEYLTPRYFGDGSVWDGTTSGWVDLNAPITRFRPEPCPEHHGDQVRLSEGRVAQPRAQASHTGDAVKTGPVGSVVKAPGAVPILGHALPLWRRPLAFLAGLPTDADVVEIRLGPKRALLAHHPDFVQQVLTDSRTFDKGGPLYEKARVLLGNNSLVSSAWDPHRQQRRMLQPAFHPSRIPGYIAVMGQEVEAEMAGWRAGQPIDVSDVMHGLTLKITARTMFATTADARAVDEVAYCMPVIMRGVYKRMIAPIGLQEKLPTAHNRDFKQVGVRMRELISRTVAAYRAGGVDNGDLLSILVNTRDPDSGRGLSDDEIHDQVMTLLIGGTETTGNTMAWAFHTLATHPGIERRLHAELDQVLAGRAPSFEDLHRLPYTGRVITEVLRMYPPAWLLTRTTTREVTLAGRTLAPGTIVMYSPYALGHNPAIFEDPETFDPDRWLPERAASLPRGVNLPFGGGSRKCIGDALGQAETAITLATIASRWRLRSVPGTKAGTAVPRASLGTGELPMIPERREPIEQTDPSDQPGQERPSTVTACPQGKSA